MRTRPATTVWTVAVLCVVGVVVASSQQRRSTSSLRDRSALSLVDTRIGTGGGGWGIGQTPPGVQVPFGCLRLSPDTSSGSEPLRIPFEAFGGYWFPHNYIEGFSHTHMVGSGIGDYQNFLVTVTRRLSDEVVQNAGYRSTFTHDEEVASPGYYAVNLQTHNVYAELAATGTHSGMHQYTCRSMAPAPSVPCHVVFDLCHAAIREHSMLNMGAACKEAEVLEFNVTNDGPNGAPQYHLTARVKQAGDMSALGPTKGIPVFFHAVISAVAVPPGAGANRSRAAHLPLDASSWMDGKLLAAPAHVPVRHMTKSGSLGVVLSALAPSLIDDVIISVRTGISFVSADHARMNMVTQQFNTSTASPGTWLTFDEAVTFGQDAWLDVLGQFQVETASASPQSDLVVFYSSVYRAHLPPTTFSEYDGAFLGEDEAVHKVRAGHRHVSDLSLWDIYRTQAPMMGFTRPSMARDIVASMTEMFQVSDRSKFNSSVVYPVWPLASVETHCMVGHHGVVVAADAIMKGVGGIDAAAAIDAVVAAIEKQDAYLEKWGFLPQNFDDRGVAKTLDFAVDAGALVHLARFLKNATMEQLFTRYAKSYAKVWDQEHELLCPTLSNGTSICPFLYEPYPWAKDYVEGNAAQYRWYAPHDVNGLVALYNSTATFIHALTDTIEYSFFWPFNNTLPNAGIWLGNEPSLLIPFLFNAAGNAYAYMTSYWLPRLLDVNYFPDAAGVPGNDDYGTMSSWLMFCYMGFYPVASTNDYFIFAPRFDYVRVSLSDITEVPYSPFRSDTNRSGGARFENNNDGDGDLGFLTIRAYGRNATLGANNYVQYAAVNGVNLTTASFTQAQLLNTSAGGALLKQATIEFWLTSEPVVFGERAPSEGGPQPAAMRPPRTRDGDDGTLPWEAWMASHPLGQLRDGNGNDGVGLDRWLAEGRRLLQKHRPASMGGFPAAQQQP